MAVWELEDRREAVGEVLAVSAEAVGEVLAVPAEAVGEVVIVSLREIVNV